MGLSLTTHVLVGEGRPENMTAHGQDEEGMHDEVGSLHHSASIESYLRLSPLARASLRQVGIFLLLLLPLAIAVVLVLYAVSSVMAWVAVKVWLAMYLIGDEVLRW